MAIDFLKGLNYTEEVRRYLSGETSNFKGEKPFDRIYRDYYVMVDNSFLVNSLDQKQTRELSSFVTSINVNYNVDSPPATADITLRTPQHLVDGVNESLTINGELEIKEMSEVRIFMKNRFPFKGSGFFGSDKGVYGYSHVFWGLVTRIVRTSNNAENSVTLNCSDMTWWLSKSRAAFLPSLYNVAVNKSDRTLGAQKSVFGNQNPFEIVYQIMNVYPEDLQSNLNQFQLANNGAQDLSDQSQRDIQNKWQQRFEKIIRNLRIFGLNGDRITTNNPNFIRNDATKSRVGKLKRPYVSQAPVHNVDVKTRESILKTNIKKALDENLLNEFLPYKEITVPAHFETSFRSRLEIAQELAKSIGFEFFQDTNGEILFKPPFYNMHVNEYENPIYVLRDLDIQEADYSSDANEVVTEIKVSGKFENELQGGHNANSIIFGLYRSAELAAIYGIQEEEVSADFCRTSKQCLNFAISELDRINARRFTSSITIEGRPELRIGRPIYIASKNEFYYIRGLSHSFSNGSFKTSLELDTRRKPFFRPNSRSNDPNTLEIIQSRATITEQTGSVKPNREELKTIVAGGDISYSSGSILHIQADETKVTRHASDQFGYELIGGFAYGKNLTISPTGKIVQRGSSKQVSDITFLQVGQEGVASIEKQDGHPDLRDNEFNIQFNNLFQSLFNLGRDTLTQRAQTLVKELLKK